jgi:nucleoside-diphosphate-sugar epimerase
LLLGATSLVGRFLVERLILAGVSTIAISRTSHAPTPGLTWVKADLRTPAIQLEHSAEIAFSLVPLWLLPPALPALHATGIRRLVAFSSTSRFTKESSPDEAERAAARRLAKAEVETQSFCESSGISWTILRPTLTYAEGRDRNISRLANLIQHFGVLPLAGDGAGKRQPVHADDLAVGAIAAAASADAEGHAYNLPGGETLTYREMSERIFQSLGVRSRILIVPPRVWQLAVNIASPLLPGVTTAMGSRMAEDLTFDPAPAARDLHWRPRNFRPVFPAT